MTKSAEGIKWYLIGMGIGLMAGFSFGVAFMGQ